MIFIKDKNVYKVARITGAQDNILGVCFTKHKVDIQVIEYESDYRNAPKTSPEDVLKQVTKGLQKINKELGKEYYISRIYFLPTDISLNSIYSYLITEIVKRVDEEKQGIVSSFNSFN